jgi:predicted aminopeptidase
MNSNINLLIVFWACTCLKITSTKERIDCQVSLVKSRQNLAIVILQPITDLRLKKSTV